MEEFVDLRCSGIGRTSGGEWTSGLAQTGHSTCGQRRSLQYQRLWDPDTERDTGRLDRFHVDDKLKPHRGFKALCRPPAD